MSARAAAALALALLLAPAAACGGSSGGGDDAAADAADADEDAAEAGPGDADAEGDAGEDAGEDALADALPGDAGPDGDAEGDALPAAFAALLEAVAAATPEEAPGLVDAFLAGVEATPLTEGTTAVFLYRGAAGDVRVVGDMTGWQIPTSPSMALLEGTDLRWHAATFEADARLDYKLVVDGAWQLDARNPRKMLGGFGPNSELAMPAYQTPPEGLVAGLTARGTLTAHKIASAALGEDRTFHVYVPAELETAFTVPPTVYFHDGNDYRSIIKTPIMLDLLLDAGAIPPLVAVFVPPTDRVAEYDRNEAYATFLADELAPFVRETFGTDPSPARTGTVGASMGGLAAIYVAFTRPDAFGLAGCQSGAYSLEGDAMIDAIAAAPAKAVRASLSVGTYETAVSGSATEGNLLEAQRRLVAVLAAKGYAHEAAELHQGHSWGQWRDTLGDTLRFLYAPAP